MDLLGGYGSSGSDGSDSDDSSVQSATGPALPPAPAAAPDAAPAASSTAPNKAGGAGRTSGGISKKGRRLLSLGAVLPPEIFDRLTREQGGGGGDSSDSDESEYGGNGNNGAGGDNNNNDDVSDNPKKKRSLKRPEDSTTTASSAADRDVGSAPGEMGDFLRELRSAPSVGPGDDGQAASARSTNTAAASKPKEEKLGMAFMSVTTTVTSKKDVGVEDIHASRPSVGVEAASGSASSDDVKKPPAAASSTAPPPAPAPAPVPMVSTIRRAAAPLVAVPRPGLTAAPPVQSAAYAPQQQQCQHQHQYRYQNQQQHQHQQHHQQAAMMGAQQSRKKSRKDLERSLRAGNFDALGDDARATTVHQDDLDYGAYAPTEADLSEAAARTAAANAAKAGPAGLRMYDPSAGADVDVGGEVSQKHRSKHQINQLVAKAAVLEAHRAGGVGPSGQRTVKGSNSRADAKRKYGW